MPNARILIVEDDRDSLRGLSTRLKKHDYDTLAAEDGTSAIRVALREKPDLILLDLMLPAGGGYFVLRRLKANTELSMIPVIVLSAKDPSEAKKKALDAGATAFLQKPADTNELLRTIQDALYIPR